MTGRDLIVYILSNNLENEPVFKDGKFIGCITAGEAAAKMGVGVATILTWIGQGRLEGTLINEDVVLVRADCKLLSEETNDN